MAFQTINRGAAPNDGTGDTARTAAGKINDNFADIARHLTRVSDTLVLFSHGCTYDAGGNIWTATAATAFAIVLNAGVLELYTASGLTPGNTFVPTKIVSTSANGLQIHVGGLATQSPGGAGAGAAFMQFARYEAGAPSSATGKLRIQDSNGNTFHVPCTSV